MYLYGVLKNVKSYNANAAYYGYLRCQQHKSRYCSDNILFYSRMKSLTEHQNKIFNILCVNRKRMKQFIQHNFS